MKACFALLALLIMNAWALGQSNLPVQPWSTFRTGTYSQIKQFQTRVVTSDAQWQKLWREMTGESNAPTGVNWGTEELWVIFMGERRTGGFSVFVQNVQFVDPRNVVVTYVERTPQPGGPVTQAITSPYVVIRAERKGGVPRFQRGQEPTIGSGTVITPVYPGWGDTGPTPIRWGLLDRGQYSNIGQERVITLQTRRELLDYARKVFPSVPQMEEMVDDVRWDSEMVVAIHLGVRQRETTVEIDRVVMEQSGRVLIQWFENSPIGGEVGRRSPYLILRIPRVTTAPTIRKVFGGLR